MNIHWFGHSKMKPIDVDEFFYRKVIIDDLEYNLNNNEKS